MVVADVHEKVASLSIQLNTIHSLNSAIHSAAPSDKQAAAESAARDRGKLFKSCVARSLANKVETWSQTSSDPKDQMKVAVQRRLQLSDVATRCGGHRMFAAAAASTIDDYTKWAAEEMKKDDGNTSKVVNAHASTAYAHVCNTVAAPAFAGSHHQVFGRCGIGQSPASHGVRISVCDSEQPPAAHRMGRERESNCACLVRVV